MRGWATENPKEAQEWLDSIQDEWRSLFDLEAVRAGMVTGMTEADSQMATDYIVTLSREEAIKPKQAGELIRLVTAGVAGQLGPAGAERWASNLPTGNLRSEARGGVARAYAECDPEAALSWLADLDNFAYNGDAYYHAFHAWTGQDPVGVGEHLNKMPVSPMRDEAIKGFAHRMINEEPSVALAWAEAINDYSFRHRSIEETFRIWDDTDAAGTHVVSMSSSPERDYAITGLSQRMSQENPLLALQWATTIGDRRMRDRAMIEAGEHLRSMDPDTAANWIEESGEIISPEVRARILGEKQQAD